MKRILAYCVLTASVFSLAGCDDRFKDEYADSGDIFYINASQDKVSVPAIAANTPFLVETNVRWRATVSYPEQATGGWCNIDLSEGMGDAAFTITAQTNYDTDGREAYLNIVSEVSENSKRFVIMQAAALPFVSVSDGLIKMPVLSADSVLFVSSNTTWTASVETSDGGNWCTLSTFSGGKGEDTRLEFGCSKNPDGVERTATITVTSVLDGSISARTEIVQKDKVAKPVITITDGNTLSIAWAAEDAAISGYGVTMKQSDGSLLKSIDTGDLSLTLVTLAGFTYTEFNSYPGVVKVTVRAKTVEADIYTDSDEAIIHTLFGAGSDHNANAGIMLVSAQRHFLNINQKLDGVFKQTANLDFTGIAFTQIGNTTTPFTGTYNAANGTDRWVISNVAVPAGTDNLALGIFGMLSGNDARIENLIIRAITVATASQKVTDMSQGAACLAGINDAGTIRNVAAENCASTGIAIDISFGHIVGNNRNNAVVEGCYTTGGRVVITTAGRGAGVVGVNQTGATVKNSSNRGSTIDVRQVAGGVVGMNSANIEDCYNTANVTCNMMAGGIAGGSNNEITSAISIKRCYNGGNMLTAQASNCHIGGIVGRARCGTGSVIEECFNTGNITVSTAKPAQNLGGIAGSVENVTVSNCYSRGSITWTNTAAGDKNIGGMVGEIVSGVTASIRYCYSLLTYTGTGNIGGILGRDVPSTSTLTSCYYLAGTASDGIAVRNIAGTYTDVLNKSQGDLQTASTYSGWSNFSAIWNSPAGSYPTLKNNPEL